MPAGRDTESRLLTDVVRSALRGEAAVLQLVGDAGIGKTHLVRESAKGPAIAQGFRVLVSTAVQGEADLPFAGLQALIDPAQDLLPRLPPDQRRAVSIALGLAAGDPGSALLLGAAFLRLLGLASEASPVLVVIDDLQWLDAPSSRCVSFAARRLGPERVAMVLATRPGHEVDGVPTVVLGGLTAGGASALLDEAQPDLAPEVHRELFTRTAGNPLALLEHARALTVPQRLGLEPGPAFLPASQRMHEYFSAQAAACPEATRRMLLLVAVEDRARWAVIAEAAGTLGLAVSDLAPAERLGLVEVSGDAARFRSTLVAQAVLQLASPDQLRATHGALAAALDIDDPAWVRHAAAACAEPDAAVADRLEEIAVRATRSGAAAAAMAAFSRAAALSADPAERARRLLGAAEAALTDGAAARALPFLDDLGAGPLPPRQQARAAWIRGRVELESGHPSRPPPC